MNNEKIFQQCLEAIRTSPDLWALKSAEKCCRVLADRYGFTLAQELGISGEISNHYDLLKWIWRQRVVNESMEWDIKNGRLIERPKPSNDLGIVDE